jgi:hypothetical protein
VYPDAKVRSARSFLVDSSRMTLDLYQDRSAIGISRSFQIHLCSRTSRVHCISLMKSASTIHMQSAIGYFPLTASRSIDRHRQSLFNKLYFSLLSVQRLDAPGPAGVRARRRQLRYLHSLLASTIKCPKGSVLAFLVRCKVSNIQIHTWTVTFFSSPIRHDRKGLS